MPLSMSMKLTGHLTESIFRRYAIVGSAALADGVAKLDSGTSEPRKVVPLERHTGS